MQIITLILLIIILAEATYLCLRRSPSSSAHQRRQVYVDTSTLMEGRILEVARTGFISDNLVIPRSVIREMQLLADGTDNEKRARARAGLDTVNELERVEQVNVEIYDDLADHTKVDERLIELAHQNHGAIMTNDFNLNKVATAENIDVLNINELAVALQPRYNTGDRLNIHIVSKGSTAGQGVGYSDDGTMVVVEHAASRIAQSVEVEVLRVMQTTSGRMIFARPVRAKRSRKAKK